jgi:hypothetical protein
MMTNRTEAMANQAVFILQFNTREAVRYVMRNASTNEEQARKAINQVVKFHKK